MRGNLLRLLFVLGLIATWAAVSSAVDSFFVPSPLDVARRIATGVRGDRVLLRALGRSLWRLGLGYGISLAGGVLLGVALARWQTLRDTVGALVLGLQAIPSICWMPLALLWFGLTEKAILTIVVLGSLLAITIATEAAVRNVSPLYVRAARTMGARGVQLYARVVLPAALPGIVSGARLGWTFAWRSLMAAELLYLSGGLGQVLATGREFHDMAQVVAVMIVIVAIGLASEHALFGRLESNVRRRWGLDRA
jgi:NitT/TauT family transport system permease protein